MRCFKKNSILICGIVFLVLCLCTNVKARDLATTEYIEFELTKDNYSEVGIELTGKVVVPETFEYGGKKYIITSIGEEAFYKCTNITEVVLPNSIKKIGASAFEWCYSLEKINIPDAVTEIEDRTFFLCESLKSIEFPESLTHIGDYAFMECAALSEVVFPENVSGIGASSFELCDGLEVVVFKGGNTTIGDDAFCSCTNLQQLQLPSSLDNISYRCFYECKKLTEIKLPETVEVVGELAFYGCNNLKEIKFSPALTTIEKNAFEKCSSLQEIELPDTLESLGRYAFFNCTSLKNAKLSLNLTKIEASTFWNCYNLTFVEIGKKITTIEDAAFCHCDNLKQIKYNGNCQEQINYWKSIAVGEYNEAFTNAKILSEHTEVIVYGYEPTCFKDGLTDGTKCSACGQWVVNQEKIFKKEHTFSVLSIRVEPTCEMDGKEIYACKEKCGETQEKILVAAGHLGGLATCMNKAVCDTCHEEYGEINTNNHIGETEVRDIKKATCAEEGYTGDTYCKGCGAKVGTGKKCDKSNTHTWNKGIVTKEPTAREIGEKTYTCTICKMDKKEKIPALGAAEVGSEQISDDGTATYKVLVSDLGNGTVSYAKPTDKNMVVVVVPATVVIDGVTYKVTAIEKSAFKNNKKIKTVIIGKNVTEIGDNAFYKCTALAKVTIPSKVKTIGKNAFYGCKKMTSVTIGKSVSKIGSKAFYGCSKLKTLKIKTTKLTTKKIGSKAFSKTPKSMKVTVPKKKFKSYKSMLVKRGVNKKAKFKKG